MYRRILLAFDGSVEGRAALREGALLAKCCGADVFLLSVIGGSAGVRMAEAAYAGALVQHDEQRRAVFAEGLERLKKLGFQPQGRIVTGEPAEEITAAAKEIGADLVVVGHRRQSLLERWWSGASGAYLSERIDCSLLISRNTITDQAFADALKRAGVAALS